MRIMTRLTKYEKETILRTSKGDREYSIFTFDQALQRKLDKFAKDYPDLCKLKFETKEGSKSYEIEKTRVSIRLMAPLSDAQKKRAREAAKKQFFSSCIYIVIALKARKMMQMKQ